MQLIIKGRSLPSLLLFGLCLLIVAGCGTSAEKSTPSAHTSVETPRQEATEAPPDAAARISTAPVTLTLFTGQSISDQEYERMIASPIRAKFPHITLQFIRQGGSNTLPNLIVAGQTPDMIYYGPGVNVLFPLDIPLDLRELLKAVPIDLNRFEQPLIDMVRSYGANGEIYSIPFLQNVFAMFYNESLFDKFAVAYPPDGMTWEDAAELAARLSRVQDGIQIRGLDPYVLGAIDRMGSALSLRFGDPATNKAHIDGKWRDVFQTALNIYAVPNNRPAQLTSTVLNDFVKEQVLAMIPIYVTSFQAQLPNYPELRWDIAQYPSFKDRPNVAFRPDYHGLVIAKSSKHPLQAMQVIQELVTEANQRTVASIGRIPVLNNHEVRAHFASEVAAFAGKRIDSIFKSVNAPAPTVFEYDNFVRAEINKAFRKVFAGEADMNTALREAEELANQAIAQELAK